MNAVRETTLPDAHRAFLITGYAAAREALNHPDLSKDMRAALARDGAVVAEGLPRPAFARHMLSVDPPDHPRLRVMAARAFTRTRLDALEPKIRLTTDELLSALAAEGDGPVDLVAGFAVPLPFIVIGDLLGIDRPDQQRPAGWFATLLTPYAGEPPPAAVAASDQIVGYLEDLVDRGSALLDGLVRDLVLAGEEGLLTRQELLSTVFQLVVAGHDTTTSLIGNGVAALLRHAEQWDTLLADPALVPRAVEEFLRWDAPVPHSTFRYAVRDVTVAGTLIPAGVQVLVSWRPPATTRSATRIRTPSTSPARAPRTWPSGTASTAASVPADGLRWDHGDGPIASTRR